MRLKTNLIISAIFIALAGFVYIYEIRGGEERREAAAQDRKLADFSDYEVRRLTIDHGDTTLVLEHGDEGWRLTAPVATGVDEAAVDRYLRALRESEIEGDPVQDSAAVAGDPGRLADYGLQQPRLRVALERVDGNSLDTLRFGDDTPTDRFTYVQRSGANPEVLRVRAWRFDNLDKGLHDLRDRRLLAFEPDDVRRLRLQRTGQTDIELTRVGGSWRLEVPLQRRADDDAVRKILSSLQNGRCQAVVDESPDAEALAAAGLAPGAQTAEVTLWLGDDLAEKRLRLGVEDAQGRVQARDTSRPQVFVVDSTVVNRMRTPLMKLRDLHLFAVDADSVTAVAVRAGDTVVFAAQKDTAGAWTLTSHPDRKAKTWRLNSLLTDLGKLEARAWVADAAAMADLKLAPFGLDHPSATIEVTLADGTQPRLWIGRRDGTDAHVMDAAVPSVAVVDDDRIESLVPSLDDVATEAVPEAAASAAGGGTSTSGE